MQQVHQKTSKLISYWLRHNPKDADVELDEFGWAEIEGVLSALRTRQIYLDIETLTELNRSFDKVRWEIDVQYSKIRATHGHSFTILLEEGKKAFPPETLYHGTASKTVASIIDKGLLSMSRQFVHLSENIRDAIVVAKRHGTPIIIEVATNELVSDGWEFYKTGDNVWLTKDISAKYLNIEPWQQIDDENKFFINELKCEIGDRKSHMLYQHLGNLDAIWRSGTCDDVLYADRDTNKHYVVHLTFKMGQESDGWLTISIYDSFEEWIEKGLSLDQHYYYDPDA